LRSLWPELRSQRQKAEGRLARMASLSIPASMPNVRVYSKLMRDEARRIAANVAKLPR
jgi:hypothetical protein